MIKREFAIYNRTYISTNTRGEIINRAEQFKIRVMARAEGYAMVFHPP